MNPKLLLFSLSLIFLIVFGQQCKKKVKPASKDYFNCASYDYFQNTEPRVYTTQDSINLMHYLLPYYKRDTIWFRNHFSGFQSVFPRIWGSIDTILWDKYFRKERATYGKLDYFEITQAIESNAVFKGRVIDIKYPKDSSKCFQYKTLLAVEVEKVLHTYFPLKKKDVVLVGRETGYTGGCTPGEDLIVDMTHYKKYRLNEVGVFGITGEVYDKTFGICKRLKQSCYDDAYCGNVFALKPDIAFLDPNDKQLLKDIISLFNK